MVAISLIHRFTNQSIRFKLIVGLSVFVVPLLALLVFHSFYAIRVVSDQVAKSNENITALYMDQIDRNLQEMDMYLSMTAAFESDLLPLGFPEHDNRDQYQFAKINLFNKMESDYTQYNFVDLMFAYSVANHDILTNAPPAIASGDLRKMKLWLSELLQDESQVLAYGNKRWFVHQSGDQYYLVIIKSIGSVYIGATVEASKLMVPLNLLELGEDGRAILVSDKDDLMTVNQETDTESALLTDERFKETTIRQKEEYLQVRKRSSQGDFSLLILLPYRTILENLPALRSMSALIVLGSIIVFPMFYIFLSYTILAPINRIMSVMRRVRDGNLEYRVEKYPVSYEFGMMNEVFNTMVSQIKELKISVYEEQLLSQRAELKHLQLQINPHFFLNALNTIYNMAQLKNYPFILEMSSYMIQYMRFMFQTNLKFISLKDEVAHTKNYLRIQAMRFHDGFTYDILEPEYGSDLQVPPLLIQTFVENTIKHAITMDEPIKITIEMQLYEEKQPYLRIVIRDTGQGFPEEVLEQFNMGHPIISEEREHIGIWNIKRRLKLLYREDARVSLINSSHGGAQIEIHVPAN
ncbi:HAMP domain-containing protein [Paenibacillus sp. LMG 31456]|uniref:HAMP domain-containing protein n=1 Tax=Paenibacillus foliorum TaxID=2654974 RepID=A0A972GMP3_9BACL|nr:histidine kinase [Paenibacillus foliorum]NOU93103.1 HAMP domain-containing protein [Paenibacillus foliorum]